MLTLYHDGRSYPIQNTEYYVRELVSGLDEVLFTLSLWDPIYAMLQEEEVIYDRGGQRYLVKQIDAGAESASIVCQLDLDAWKADLRVDYSNGSATVLQTIEAVKPTGWTVQDRAYSSIRRTISGTYTPFEICQACTSVYSVYIRWDTRQKVCQILPQTMAPPLGAFATRQLNLKDIQYKGKSIDFATRLYPYGKKDEDGNALTIEGAEIDGAVYPYPYVENRAYADKTISAYWSDERYTIVQDLYDDAVKKLEKLAIPTRSYECSIVDLQATNPEKYGALDFSLLTTALLVDDVKDVAIQYQVVERHVYPYHPEKNEIVFDNAPIRITSAILSVTEEVENPNSTFRQILDQEITMATDWLTNNDSHVYIVPDGNGGVKEFLFLDGTQDPSTATHVMRLNSSGMGFSRTGVNGPYTNAFVFDDVLGGHLIADFITAGTLTANLLKAGRIQAHNGTSYWDLDTDTLWFNDSVTVGSGSSATTLAQINVNKTGISAEVTRATAAEGTLSSRITQNADAITSKVSAGDIASAINQTAQSVLIQASKIDLSGLVTVSSLAAGTTAINGGCITTGTISGDRISGGSIEGAIITSGAPQLGQALFYVGPDPSTAGAGAVWATHINVMDNYGYPLGGWRPDSSTENNPPKTDGGVDHYMRIVTGYGIHVGSENGQYSIFDGGVTFKSGVYSLYGVLQFTSDRRQKHDIEPLTDAERVIYGLKPVTFRYNHDAAGRLHHGFIAQDVQPLVDPEWAVVEQDPDPGSDTLFLGYIELIADLVSVVQSLNKRLKEVETWKQTAA